MRTAKAQISQRIRESLDTIEWRANAGRGFGACAEWYKSAVLRMLDGSFFAWRSQNNPDRTENAVHEVCQCLWSMDYLAKKVLSDMRKRWGFTLTCTCAKSHPGICTHTLKHFIVSNDSVCGQRKPWLDCADAQADQSFAVAYARRHVFALRGALLHITGH